MPAIMIQTLTRWLLALYIFVATLASTAVAVGPIVARDMRRIPTKKDPCALAVFPLVWPPTVGHRSSKNGNGAGQDATTKTTNTRRRLPNNICPNKKHPTAIMGVTITPGQVNYCSSEQEYYEYLQKAGDKLIVIDCFAEWCPPCKAIAPVYDALARHYQNKNENIVFLKVDVDKVPAIKSILSVWAMPSFYFIKHSKVVGSFMGANESKLRYGLDHDGSVGICSSCSIL